MKAGDKEDFCREGFSWEIPIRWFDCTGVHKLREDVLARIELGGGNTGENHIGFLVTIINTTKGKVDSKLFEFDDYLHRSLDARVDKRQDYPLDGNTCFVVWARQGDLDWYIAKPKSTRPFCEAVEAYIAFFYKDHP